jgi:hypothetical protein
MGTIDLPDPPPLPKFDPRMPLDRLLPPPPKTTNTPVYLGDDLASVPELMLEAAPAEALTTKQWQNRKGLAAAAALHLNGKEEDGFLKALLRERSDLAGLPFVMGGNCRTKGARKAAFKSAADKVRRQKAAALAEGPEVGATQEKRQHYWQAHAAVVAQIMAGEITETQGALIRSLAAIPRPEATRALARVALFAPDETVRARAVEALSVRRQRDYTEVLVAGLRYPWPAVAQNAAHATVKLERKDLIGQLRTVLNEPDPRGPRTEMVDGRKVAVAHELVRINHLRNCMLCHPPAEHGKTPEDVLVADMPLPSESLPDSSEGYGRPQSNLLVRIDVTYLRQDFSALEVVKEFSPWPRVQRFDFVVRKRVLSPAEADDLRARLQKREQAEQSPFQRAAADALRQLTGRDFEVKAEPRRRLLASRSF